MAIEFEISSLIFMLLISSCSAGNFSQSIEMIAPFLISPARLTLAVVWFIEAVTFIEISGIVSSRPSAFGMSVIFPGVFTKLIEAEPFCKSSVIFAICA